VSIGKLGAQRRIVGGDEAGFGSFPWQAYIRIGSSRCGGSLVNRFHVVTAGHCVARYLKLKVIKENFAKWLY
jgi:transmembrane protease serine 6